MVDIGVGDLYVLALLDVVDLGGFWWCQIPPLSLIVLIRLRFVDLLATFDLNVAICWLVGEFICYCLLPGCPRWSLIRWLFVNGYMVIDGCWTDRTRHCACWVGRTDPASQFIPTLHYLVFGWWITVTVDSR